MKRHNRVGIRTERKWWRETLSSCDREEYLNNAKEDLNNKRKSKTSDMSIHDLERRIDLLEVGDNRS